MRELAKWLKKCLVGEPEKEASTVRRDSVSAAIIRKPGTRAPRTTVESELQLVDEVAEVEAPDGIDPYNTSRFDTSKGWHARNLR